MKTTIAALTATVALTIGAPVALATGIYHGPDQKPRWLTTECQVDGPPAANCYWDGGSDGQGHPYWVIPIGDTKLGIVYWNPAYNQDHGYIVNR